MPSGGALVLNAFDSNRGDAGWERLRACNERDTEPPYSVVLPGMGEAHPRGSRSDSDAPWWDTRGTGEPSLRRRTPKSTMGSYAPVVQEAGISFHGFDSKRE